MKLFLTLSLVFVCVLSRSQSNTVTSGGNASGNGGSISYSVGQIDYIQLSGPGGTASTGNQQPFEIHTASLDDLVSLKTVVYPNPASNFIVISFKESPKTNTFFTVCDSNGKKLKTDSLTQKESKISLASLANSIYYLTITENQKEIKSFKIVKNQ